MARSFRPARLALAVLLAVMVLAACGTTDPPQEESVEPAGDAVTITDGRGELITLPEGPATRVVTLELGQTEMVTSLGVNPVGVADVEGYQSWVGAVVPLAEDPIDVGIRREPSIEAIAELEPDLVLGSLDSVPQEAMDQMERIAPVALLAGADAGDPLQRIEEDFATVATLVGAEQEAQDLLDELDERVAANATRIEDAGLSGTPIVFTAPHVEGANVTIRMHGPGSAPQAVAEEMGLTAAWEDAGDEAFGLSSIDLEGLTELPEDARFMYWGNEDSEDPVQTGMAGNPVWESLPFVQEGHVHRAAVGIWVYGGPESLGAWSDDLVSHLEAE